MVISGHGTAVFDKNGVPTRVEESDVEQDTYTANGKTLVGSDSFHVAYTFEGGVQTSAVLTGRMTSIPLPGGGTFHSSGWTNVFTPQGWFMTVDSGLSGDFGAFCAALST